MVCPTCEKEFDLATVPQHALPFCCTRCKQRDLRRWLNEAYTFPSFRNAESELDEGDVEE
jgi:endogenous inhibitor of DNA gyrase (YacG/DUF329 family)